MQRGSVGGVEPNGAAIHVRESHDSSSTTPDEYKSHTHSLDVSLSFRFRICRARDQASKFVFDETAKTWYATFKTSWPAGAATNPERRKLHPETAFNLRMLHCALGGPAQGLAKPSQVSQSYGTLTRTFVLCVRQASLQILKVGIDARRPRLRYASRCCLYLLECSSVLSLTYRIDLSYAGDAGQRATHVNQTCNRLRSKAGRRVVSSHEEDVARITPGQYQRRTEADGLLIYNYHTLYDSQARHGAPYLGQPYQYDFLLARARARHHDPVVCLSASSSSRILSAERRDSHWFLSETLRTIMLRNK